MDPKKVMLCIWWDRKGVVHYELPPPNQTISSDKYCSQMADLKTAIEAERSELANCRGIVFHQDNARPHVSMDVRRKLLD